MRTNYETILKFYTAFSNGDASQMCECYHSNAKFSDPIFESLKGEDVCNMWQMLLKKSKGNININFSEIDADKNSGSARWTASYNFSKTNRKVVNSVYAQFKFKDGLILKHTDDFDIWKWAKQALGWKGFLFGWTGYLQKKIQNQALSSLNDYKKQNL